MWAFTYRLVKSLISNWLYFIFRLGCLIEKFTAKNNMRLYTIFSYICVIMIATHSQRKNCWLLYGFIYDPKRYNILYSNTTTLNFTSCYRCRFRWCVNVSWYGQIWQFFQISKCKFTSFRITLSTYHNKYVRWVKYIHYNMESGLFKLLRYVVLINQL